MDAGGKKKHIQNGSVNKWDLFGSDGSEEVFC